MVYVRHGIWRAWIASDLVMLFVYARCACWWASDLERAFQQCNHDTKAFGCALPLTC